MSIIQVSVFDGNLTVTEREDVAAVHHNAPALSRTGDYPFGNTTVATIEVP